MVIGGTRAFDEFGRAARVVLLFVNDFADSDDMLEKRLESISGLIEACCSVPAVGNQMLAVNQAKFPSLTNLVTGHIAYNALICTVHEGIKSKR